MLGKVEALYSKGGGKNGKQSAVTAAQNIAQVSRVALRVYEPLIGRIDEFSPVTWVTRPHKNIGFVFVPSLHFLSLLQSPPIETKTPGTGGIRLRLAHKMDRVRFAQLCAARSQIQNAIKLHNKRGPRKKKAASALHTAVSVRSPSPDPEDVEMKEVEDLGW